MCDVRNYDQRTNEDDGDDDAAVAVAASAAGAINLQMVAQMYRKEVKKQIILERRFTL